MADLIHSVCVGAHWPPNVADSVTFPCGIAAPAARMREAGRDVITGVPPYQAGRGTVHYIFWASSED